MASCIFVYLKIILTYLPTSFDYIITLNTTCEGWKVNLLLVDANLDTCVCARFSFLYLVMH